MERKNGRRNGKTINITNNRIEEWGVEDNQKKQMERKRGEGMGKTINIIKNRRTGEEGAMKGKKWKEKREKEWKNY